MSGKKRRKNDAGDGDNDDAEDSDRGGGGKPSAVVVPSRDLREQQKQKFRRLMKANFHASFGNLNERYAKLIAGEVIPDEYDGLDDPRAVRFAGHAFEYLRCAERIHYLYGRTPGEVVSFGSNDMNQLGVVCDVENKLAVYPATFVHMPPNSQVRQVASGGTHSLAALEDGSAYSWGSSDDGVLGRDSKDEAHPKPVTGFVNTITNASEDGTIIAVAAGAAHSLFLTIAGNVYMCGIYKDADSSKFCSPGSPAGSPLGQKDRPVHIYDMPGEVIRIEAGASANAAILEDRSMVTWGFGTSGELARSADMTTPNAEGKYDIGKEFFFKHERDDKGNISFGDPDVDKVRKHFLTPKPPRWAGAHPYPKKVVLNVACGDFHLLVAARDPGDAGGISRLYTSGLNQYGQLGLGDEESRHQLTVVPKLERCQITYVAAGQHHSLALSLSGEQLFAFGRSDNGQLGTGPAKTGMFENTPLPVAFPKRVLLRQIDAGDHQSFALTDENELYSWGMAELGYTGHITPEADIKRPWKLANFGENENFSVHVHNVSGGSQHGMAVVKRYRKAC